MHILCNFLEKGNFLFVAPPLPPLPWLLRVKHNTALSLQSLPDELHRYITSCTYHTSTVVHAIPCNTSSRWTSSVHLQPSRASLANEQHARCSGLLCKKPTTCLVKIKDYQRELTNQHLQRKNQGPKTFPCLFENIFSTFYLCCLYGWANSFMQYFTNNLLPLSLDHIGYQLDIFISGKPRWTMMVFWCSRFSTQPSQTAVGRAKSACENQRTCCGSKYVLLSHIDCLVFIHPCGAQNTPFWCSNSGQKCEEMYALVAIVC